MSSNLYPIIFALAIGALAVLTALIKSGHFIRYLILSSISGIGSLFAVNLLSSVTGVSIALNYITLSVSSVFGISGVIGLLLSF
jgi:hypothetical protein